MDWKLARTFTAQTAESAAPSAGDFVTLPQGGKSYGDGARQSKVELSIGTLTFGGTVAASAVTLAIWRLSGGRIDRVGSIVCVTGVTPDSPLIDFNGESICIRAESFTGGTAPTVAGTVYARGA